MKNYKVVATRKFRDSNEIDPMTYSKKERQKGDEFFCTKERYEFLKQNNAVELIEIIDENVKHEEEKDTVEETFEEVIEKKPKKKKNKKEK